MALTRTQRGFLNTRLARRTLLLFVLCSLIPMVVLSFQTNRKVNQFYLEQQQQELRRSAKGFGLIIHERLQIVAHQTRLARDKLQLLDKITLESYVNDLNLPQTTQVVLDKFGGLFKHSGFRQTFDPQQRDITFLKSGNGLLVFTTKRDRRSDIWLVYLLETVSGDDLLAFQIDPAFLWQNLDVYDAAKQFSVSDDGGQRLFQTSNFQSHHTASEGDAPSLINNNWELFLNSKYAVSNWRIEVQEEETEAGDQFQYLVWQTTLLAILLASLISSYAIRRNTEPINALSQGIEHINNNQFDYKVDIQSGDEFEDLGKTFNNMAGKIGQHLSAMQSLSAIDKLILDRLKIEDVVHVVMNDGLNLLQAQHIHFLIKSSDVSNPDEFIAFSSRKDSAQNKVQIDKNKIQKFNNPGNTRVWSDIPSHLSIAPEIEANTLVFTSLLEQDQQPKAILIAEFNDSPDKDLLSIAALFMDHINVALANCEWEQKLFQQAHFDLLTGLPNRYLFNEQLNNSLGQAHRADQKVAIFLIDIDDFSTVNDTFGHEAGDKFLVEIANRLNQTLGSHWFLSRLGGDEFGLIYTSDVNSRTSILEETGRVAEQLRLLARQPISINHSKIHHTISVGIAIYPDDSLLSEELLKYASYALHQAKSEEKNGIRYYSLAQNSASLRRETMIDELHRALANNEFELYYQPKIDLVSQHMEGCEALIRWNHPERGLLPPGLFIPQIEEYGLMNDVGLWVIREAIAQKIQWEKTGCKTGRIAVNVSVIQLIHKDFCSDVINILAATGCDGSGLEFEITETAYVRDMDRFYVVLTELSKTGIIFSVDDYGTGYSSLSLLLKLPVSKLKIDKTFIDDIETNELSRAIVESTINLSRKMKLLVIAEGVENLNQLRILKDYNCDHIQGYLFSKPVQAEELQKLAQNNPFQTIFNSITALK